MSEVAVMGMDLAKSVFQVHGVDEQGQTVLQRRLSRGQVLKLFERCCQINCTCCGMRRRG